MTRAILRHLDREQLEDVARHGADAGWSGFTYYTDTCAFYKAHKGDILKLAQDMASELGEDMLDMISHFRCLSNNNKPDYTPSEIAEALYSGRGECADLIRNAMAWFALEETARELNPELYNHTTNNQPKSKLWETEQISQSFKTANDRIKSGFTRIVVGPKCGWTCNGGLQPIPVGVMTRRI